MVLYLLRGAFILLAASVTMLYLLPFQQDQELNFEQVVLMLGITLGIAMAVIAADWMTGRRKLSAMSGIFLGLIVGLVLAYALGFVVDLIVRIAAPEQRYFADLMRGVKVFIGLITCYLGISLVIQTKDDFRFVIPYVEFSKQLRGNRPILLDTSVIIDGRILDIVEARFLQDQLVVPKFILHELQIIADSADKIKRVRGRRGMDILRQLQENQLIDVLIDETDAEGSGVDQKLVTKAQNISARIMTNDYNLNKIATLRGVDVMNINDLTQAVQPVVLPGESMTVKVAKAGEGSGQGVGYLDDGTMVVIENSRSRIGQKVLLIVTSTLQTSAGRMIFGRLSDSESHQATD